MKNPGTLKVTTPSEREIMMTRSFDAPRHLVFDALSMEHGAAESYDRLAELLASPGARGPA